jgi:hypothetical protein
MKGAITWRAALAIAAGPAVPPYRRCRAIVDMAYAIISATKERSSTSSLFVAASFDFAKSSMK